MSRNADIRGWFRPQSQSQTTRAGTATASSPPTSQRSLPTGLRSSPDLSSTPRIRNDGLRAAGSQAPSPSPGKAADGGKIDRGRVIQGSDDEYDDDKDNWGDSDSEFDDLATILQRRKPGPGAGPSGGGSAPTARRPEGNPAETPRAKRTALQLHASPLTRRPKHKFDMKALLSHAQQHDATEASSREVASREEKHQQMIAAAAAAAAEDDNSDENGENPVRFLAGNGEDAKMMKVRKAVERTEASASRRMRWYFFDTQATEEASLAASLAHKFPESAAAAGSPWAFLADAKTRDQHILSGLPLTLVTKLRQLPDDLFVWMVHEACLSDAVLVRRECVRLVDRCPDQIRRLMTPALIREVFMGVGGGKGLQGMETGDRQRLKNEMTDAYAGRDWSKLQAALSLLSEVAASMPPTSAVYAAKILIWLAVDKVILDNVALLMGFHVVMLDLLHTLPPPEKDGLCVDMAKAIATAFPESVIRLSPLLCLPGANPDAHALRQRLAIAFFFDDPELARSQPIDVSVLTRALGRLQDERFRIGQDTNYVQLTADMHLLNMALDDGAEMIGIPGGEAERQFNARVDELAGRLKAIWSQVNDSGMSYISRTEAKSVIEWLQERLSYTVRSRPKPKRSIFDLPAKKVEVVSARQQDLMRGFARRSTPSSGPPTTTKEEQDGKASPDATKEGTDSKPVPDAMEVTEDGSLKLSVDLPSEGQVLIPPSETTKEGLDPTSSPATVKGEQDLNLPVGAVETEPKESPAAAEAGQDLKKSAS